MSRPVIAAVMVALALAGCAGHAGKPDASSQRVLDRIERAARAYEAPGHAVVLFDRDGIVDERYGGFANVANATPVTADTLFPVASLTKLWSAVVLLQLVDEGRLKLEQPVVDLVPGIRLPATVQVRHLLSHTSQGTPGAAFHYDGRRYSVLARVIEAASGERFDAAIRRRIIAPLGLEDTFLLGDDAAHTPRVDEIATPYRYEGANTDCEIEYGHSASAGLVSTARDLAAFDIALLRGDLLPPQRLAHLMQPFLPAGPTGLGDFVQDVDGSTLAWGYGQYDCYAALNIMRTADGTGMVFLANNNVPSDAARLLHGDVTTSAVALAWLQAAPDGFAAARAELLREVYLLPSRPTQRDAVIEHAEALLARMPPAQDVPDLAIVHALLVLVEVSPQRQPVFEQVIEHNAQAMLAADAANPYAHYALATLFAKRGERAQAQQHYRAIVDAPNASRNWYTVEAEAALATPD